jgi:hypothetical protein
LSNPNKLLLDFVLSKVVIVIFRNYYIIEINKYK